jgi:hypothetical protein
MKPYLKTTKSKRAGEVIQVVECMALSLNASTTRNLKKQKLERKS